MRSSFFLILFSLLLVAEKPDLLLLKSYKSDTNVTGWLISEKLDGIRAYWDGKQLLTRSGNIIHAPIWFTKGFPSFEIDGELWTKRDDFEHIVSIVNRKKPHEGWREITYNIFEVPHQKGGLLRRLGVLKSWLQRHPTAFIKIIPQEKCLGTNHLEQRLKEVESKKAEGLVVRNPDVPYIDKRTSSALKVKRFSDDECIVKDYTKGHGKYKGLVGALVCEWHGKRLKIGSGLSLIERKNPPKIGTQITFKYQGLTKYGNPKYPVFLRIRNFK